MLGAFTNGELDVLLVSWDGGGNVPPLLALGKRLAARGRRVCLLGPQTLAERSKAAGLGFRPFAGEMSWTTRPGVAIEDEMSSLSAHLTGPEIGTELLDAAEAHQPKALVVDGMAAAAVVAAERLRIPTAVLIHTRYRYNEAAGWGPLVVPVNSVRRQFGLEPLTEQPGWFAELWRRAGTVLVASYRQLEGERQAIATHVRHVGPILDPDPAALPDDVAAIVQDPAGALVVVSLSSTYMHHEEVLARIVQALNQVDGRSVITLGNALDPTCVLAPGRGVAGAVGRSRAAAAARRSRDHARRSGDDPRRTERRGTDDLHAIEPTFIGLPKQTRPLAAEGI